MDYDQACRILNLNLKHTQTQLKKAYHIAALKNHPDKNKDKENANTQFQEISAAYGFLLNNHSERYCYVNHDISYKNLLRKIISEFDVSFDNPIFIETTFKSLLSKVSLKVFENIDKEKSQHLFDFIKQYNSIFNYDNETLKKIQEIVKYKMREDNVVILNPTLDDLLEGNIYKLEVFGKTFYIPLWHQELYYDISGSDLIVKIMPPEFDVSNSIVVHSVNIDNNNNLFIGIDYSMVQILKDNKLEFKIGERIFSFPGEELKIIKKQMKVLYNEGIFKMNNNNIFDPKGKKDIYIEINLY
tara:strand:+ start:16151 stop:17050 length:900 start_codon:yes stop_codon:yes gene_type:complete